MRNHRIITGNVATQQACSTRGTGSSTSQTSTRYRPFPHNFPAFPRGSFSFCFSFSLSSQACSAMQTSYTIGTGVQTSYTIGTGVQTSYTIGTGVQTSYTIGTGVQTSYTIGTGVQTSYTIGTGVQTDGVLRHRANSSISAMRPPCYYLLEEIVILGVIYGSLVWMVCKPVAPAGPRGIPGLSPGGTMERRHRAPRRIGVPSTTFPIILQWFLIQIA